MRPGPRQFVAEPRAGTEAPGTRRPSLPISNHSRGSREAHGTETRRPSFPRCHPTRCPPPPGSAKCKGCGVLMSRRVPGRVPGEAPPGQTRFRGAPPAPTPPPRALSTGRFQRVSLSRVLRAARLPGPGAVTLDATLDASPSSCLCRLGYSQRRFNAAAAERGWRKPRRLARWVSSAPCAVAAGPRFAVPVTSRPPGGCSGPVPLSGLPQFLLYPQPPLTVVVPTALKKCRPQVRISTTCLGVACRAPSAGAGVSGQPVRRAWLASPLSCSPPGPPALRNPAALRKHPGICFVPQLRKPFESLPLSLPFSSAQPASLLLPLTLLQPSLLLGVISVHSSPPPSFFGTYRTCALVPVTAWKLLPEHLHW